MCMLMLLKILFTFEVINSHTGKVCSCWWLVKSHELLNVFRRIGKALHSCELVMLLVHKFTIVFEGFQNHSVPITNISIWCW